MRHFSGFFKGGTDIIHLLVPLLVQLVSLEICKSSCTVDGKLRCGSMVRESWLHSGTDFYFKKTLATTTKEKKGGFQLKSPIKV